MTRPDRAQPATLAQLRARATTVITDRLRAGRGLSAAWLAGAAGLTDGGALMFLREHATAGRLTCHPAGGGPAAYHDTWTAAVPADTCPTTPATTTAPAEEPSPAPATTTWSGTGYPGAGTTPTASTPAAGCAPPAPTACASSGTATTSGVFRVLVTGSRAWTDARTVTTALNDLHAVHGGRLTVVHGACPTGADRIADGWARRHGVHVEAHPAHWQIGRGAGPARNTAMVATAPALCLAFIRDASPGATGCANTAEHAGIRTTRHTHTTAPRAHAVQAGPPDLTPPAPALDQATHPAAEHAGHAGHAGVGPGLPDATDVLFADLDLVGV